MKIEQITEIKNSTNDFVILAQKLSGIGVETFQTKANNIETVYTLIDGEQILETAADFNLEISKTVNKVQVIAATKLHQNHELDFFAWLEKITEHGVAYWIVDLNAKSCTYFGLEGQLIFTEDIPLI